MAARIEGVLLAAGESRRMGYPKALLTVGQETFVARLARLMLEVTPRVVVVTGAYADQVRSALPGDPRLVAVFNPDFATGQLSSLKCGLAAVSPQADAALVHLVDHPLIELSTLRGVVAAFTGEPPILIARAAGKRGHPVLFARSLFGELMEAPEAVGARAVVNRDPGRVAYLDVQDPGVTADLDTPGDLAQAGLPAPPSGGKP